MKVYPLLLATIINLGINHSLCVSQVRVSPDTSNITRTSNNNGIISVNGGRRVSSNVFHAFDELSLTNEQELIFNNPSSVQNIFSIISGSKSSSLNGGISTESPANLFLLNRNGIVFGDNFRLNIAGSFFASTADLITFDDGSVLSSNSIASNSLLPSGNPSLYTFSENSGEIIVNGDGHNLNFDPASSIALNAGLSASGIRVEPGSDIVLLGNGITFNGGIVTAPSGRINIASIEEGSVAFRGFSSDQGFQPLGYQSVREYSDISFDGRALVDASGSLGGLIGLNGENLAIEGGSHVLIQNQEGVGGGEISLDFQENILHRGISDQPTLGVGVSPLINTSGVISSSIFSNSADINIKSRNLSLLNAGVIFNSVSLTGNGGDINVDVNDSIEIRGDVLPDPQSAFSTILITNNGMANSGSIVVKANDISLSEHGTIQTNTFSSGSTGDISVIANDSVSIGTFSPISGLRTSIFSITFREGTSANVNLEARRLSAVDNGTVSSITIASGDSGDVNVDVSDTISLSGFRLNSDGIPESSGIGSIASTSTEEEVQRFGLPAIPSGNLGDTFVATKNLFIDDNAVITASNFGTGSTGDILVEADTIRINNSSIESLAINNNGGNLAVVSQLLDLRNSGRISVNSLGQGNGGNIAVNSDLLLLSSGGSIVANSADARGGNISISASGIFASPDSLVSASSDLGELFSGTIEFNTPNVDLLRAATTIEIPPEVPKIAVVCNSTGEAGELTVAGSAGQPIASNDYTESRLKFYEQGKVDGEPLIITDPVTGEDEKFERFVGWAINPDGKTLRLVSDPNEAIQFQGVKQACLKDSQAA